MSALSVRNLHLQRRAVMPRSVCKPLNFALSGLVCLLIPNAVLAQASSRPGDGLGQAAFNNSCRTCHMTKEGDNRLGPNLHKIVGRKAGSLQNYPFSSAMKQAGFVWDEEKLEQFIANPDLVVPGHNMKPYGGLSSSEDRKNIVSFLSQQE
jgi:cytochrome c